MWTDRILGRVVVSPAVFLAVMLGPAPVAAQASNPFLGSVPAGTATGTTLDLSLPDAVDRALKSNLGVFEGRDNALAAEAIRLRSLNALMPNLTARVTASENEINPKAEGINLTIPGVTLPPVFGPFGVNDARVAVTQELFNWSDRQGLKASTELTKAAQYAYANDRETVVFTAGAAYLLVIADAAAVDSIQAQVVTAQT